MIKFKHLNRCIISSKALTVVDVVERDGFSIRIEVLLATLPAYIRYEFPIDIPIQLYKELCKALLTETLRWNKHGSGLGKYNAKKNKAKVWRFHLARELIFKHSGIYIWTRYKKWVIPRKRGEYNHRKDNRNTITTHRNSYSNRNRRHWINTQRVSRVDTQVPIRYTDYLKLYIRHAQHIDNQHRIDPRKGG